MPESRITSNQLEVLTKSNHGRITTIQLEVLSKSASNARITSVQLEVLAQVASLQITGIAVSATRNTITVIGNSGSPITYDLHRSLTPGFIAGIGNRILAGITPTGLPQDIHDDTISPATWYFYRLVENNAGGSLVSNEIAIESLGFGTPPELTVGNLTGTEALLSVKQDLSYTDVHYLVAHDTDVYYLSPVFEATDSSSDRFNVIATGLSLGLRYRAKANWNGPLGWSGYSNEVVFNSVPITISSFDTVRKPKFGETISGIYTFTWPPMKVGEKSTVSISSNLGATWSTLVSGLVATNYSLNTVGYSDGVNYVLKVVGDMGTIYYQLCFYIDNANLGDYFWHDNVNWDTDIYDSTQFSKALNTNANWSANQTTFALLSQAGGTDLGALIARNMLRHSDFDITTAVLGDSGEGGYPWSRYWAAEGLQFGVICNLEANQYVATYVQTNLFYPWGYPDLYGCGPWKGVSYDTKLCIEVRSGPFLSRVYLNLPEFHVRVRGCYDNPSYYIRLKVNHPDRANYPYRVRVRATIFGPGLLLPSTFVNDYWLYDQVLDLEGLPLIDIGPPPIWTKYPLDCGCAGAIAGKIHGSIDDPGRSEFSTLGGAILDIDCISTGGIICLGVPVIPPTPPGIEPCIVCAIIPSFGDASAGILLAGATGICGPGIVVSVDDDGLVVGFACA